MMPMPSTEFDSTEYNNIRDRRNCSEEGLPLTVESIIVKVYVLDFTVGCRPVAKLASEPRISAITPLNTSLRQVWRHIQNSMTANSISIHQCAQFRKRGTSTREFQTTRRDDSYPVER